MSISLARHILDQAMIWKPNLGVGANRPRLIWIFIQVVNGYIISVLLVAKLGRDLAHCISIMVVALLSLNNLRCLNLRLSLHIHTLNHKVCLALSLRHHSCFWTLWPYFGWDDSIIELLSGDVGTIVGVEATVRFTTCCNLFRCSFN